MTAPDMSAIRDRAVELVEQAPAAERSRAERRVARLFGVRRATVHRWMKHGEALESLGRRDRRSETLQFIEVHTSTRVIALVALFLLGLDRPIAAGATTGLLPVVVLAPMWSAAIRRYRGAGTLAALVTVAVIAGLFLAQSNRADHSVSLSSTRSTLLLLLTCFGMCCLLLWARRFMKPEPLVIAYGTGLLLNNVLSISSHLNVWKFSLSLPLTLIGLAIASSLRRRWLTIMVLISIAVSCSLNDARSFTGFAILTSVLVIFQARGTRTPKRRRRLLEIGLLAALAAAMYFLVTSLLVNGYLGADLQLRTRHQIQTSGSLIAGGRPEWSATLQLMRDTPLGFGVGVVPNSHDIAIGKTGLDPLQIPTIDGYAENYMFGGSFKLHSVAADLWSSFGPLGFMLAAVIAARIVDGLAHMLSRRQASGLLIFLAILALWDLAFGPIYSNLRYVSLALGIALIPTAPRRQAPDNALVGNSL